MSTLTFVCNNISSLVVDDKIAAKNVQYAVLQSKVNWQEVIEFASGWLVLPALYDNLNKQQLWTDIPDDIYLYLKTIHELSEARTLRTQEDIKKIHAYFIEKNIPAVAIKGAAYLVNNLYSGATFRIESDIDLLIPDNYLTASYSLLKKNGFSAPKEYETQWERSPKGHHLPSLLDESGTEVEIHQFLYPQRITTLLTSAEVWDDAILHNDLPHSPSSTHMIMLILIHAMMSDRGYCMQSLNLRAASDILLIRKKYESKINWEFIEKRFKTAHLQHIPVAYFQLIELLLGTPSPAIFKKTWRTSVFIYRVRFNYWLRCNLPRLYKFLSPFKKRYCHEKSIIGKLVKEYWIRLYNKMV